MSHLPAEIHDQPSTTTILDLNDHVLRETFQNLSTLELAVIANVCSVFKRNAMAEFSHRYKDKSFDVEIYIEASKDFTVSDRENAIRLPIWQSSSILRNFGTLISSLRMVSTCNNSDNHWLSQYLMENIIKYCRPTLQELELHFFIFSANIMTKLRPFLPQLKKLRLVYCRWASEKDASDMISFCSGIHSLSLTPPFVVNHTLPKLKSFEIEGIYTNEPVENCLKANPQLEELRIHSIDDISSKLFTTIVKHSPQIEKLSFIFGCVFRAIEFIENAKCLKHLIALKSLHIDCQDQSFTPVIKELTEAGIMLESLRLERFISDREFIDEIAALKSLKELRLCNPLQPVDALAIIKKLNELTHLELNINLLATDLVKIIHCSPKMRELTIREIVAVDVCSIWILDEIMFMKIVDVVKRRKEEGSLCLKLSLLEGKIDVPKEIRVANAGILQIIHR